MSRPMVCVLFFASGLAGLAQPTSPAPKIEFDSTAFNFGRAKSGETLKHDFIFTNMGNAILEVTDVKPGCGCTTAGAWDKFVEPGKTGRIPLQFNSTGFGGQVAKSATVICNDPARTNLFLQISGTVWKPIDVAPQMAMFNINAEAPTNETKVLKIVSNLEEPVTLSDLKCNNGSFKAEIKGVKPGKEFELYVTAVPPFSNATVFSTITFKSSSTNAPMLSVSAYAMVQQAVTVSPQQVVIPSGPLKNPVTSSVMVRNGSTNALQLSDVRLDLKGVEVKVNQPQTGQLYSISMTFPVGFELQQLQKAEDGGDGTRRPASGLLTMKTSHPKFPEIKVPIVQMRPMPVAAAPKTGPTATPAVTAGPSPLRTASPVTRPLTASPVPTGGR